MSKPTKEQLKLLKESGVDVSIFLGLGSDKPAKKAPRNTRKAAKKATSKKRKTTKTNVKIGIKAERMIDEIIAEQKSKGHPYTYSELAISTKPCVRMTLRQYQNMIQTILDHPKIHKKMISEIAKAKGCDKILKIQQLIFIKFDELVHIGHCQELLSNKLFGYKASEYSSDSHYVNKAA